VDGAGKGNKKVRRGIERFPLSLQLSKRREILPARTVVLFFLRGYQIRFSGTTNDHTRIIRLQGGYVTFGVYKKKYIYNN
jgi:hypothetical protein